MKESGKMAHTKERKEELLSFHLPRWSELPSENRLRQATLDYIGEVLRPLSGMREPLTGTMVQNYIKWGLLPRPEKRRYGRRHIARLIALAILKEVLPIQRIHSGMVLQTRLVSEMAAYDLFGSYLENALRRACRMFAQLDGGARTIELEGLRTGIHGATLAFICESFAFKLIAEHIIEEQGIARIQSQKSPLEPTEKERKS